MSYTKLKDDRYSPWSGVEATPITGPEPTHEVWIISGVPMKALSLKDGPRAGAGPLSYIRFRMDELLVVDRKLGRPVEFESLEDEEWAAAIRDRVAEWREQELSARPNGFHFDDETMMEYKRRDKRDEDRERCKDG